MLTASPVTRNSWASWSRVAMTSPLLTPSRIGEPIAERRVGPDAVAQLEGGG